MDAKDEEGIPADRGGRCVCRWRLPSIKNNIPFNFVPWGPGSRRCSKWRTKRAVVGSAAAAGRASSRSARCQGSHNMLPSQHTVHTHILEASRLVDRRNIAQIDLQVLVVEQYQINRSVL
jgi:hypothetical protein